MSQNPTFSDIEHLANGKKLRIVCRYHYELYNPDNEMVFWSYYLEDVENFLRTYNA